MSRRTERPIFSTPGIIDCRTGGGDKKPRIGKLKPGEGQTNIHLRRCRKCLQHSPWELPACTGCGTKFRTLEDICEGKS